MRLSLKIIVLFILLLSNFKDAIGEVTIHIFYPGLVNSTFRVEVNGKDLGYAPLEIKSIKEATASEKADNYVDLITYRKGVLPITVEAEGPVNIFVEYKYEYLDSRVAFSSEEITIEPGRSNEYFFEVKLKGILLPKVQIKELTWAKGNKKLKSNKWTLLPRQKLKASEMYKPSDEFLASRAARVNQNESEREFNRSMLKKEFVGSLDTLLHATLDLALSITKLAKGDFSANTSSANTSPTALSGGATESVDEDMYYIPDLLASIDREKIGPMERELNTIAEIREKNSKAHEKGRKISQTERRADQKKTLGGTDDMAVRAAQSTIQYFEQIKQAVVAYGRRNHTDYISEEDYNNIVHTRFVASEKNSKERLKLHKERTKVRSDKTYQRYVDMLMRHFYSNDGRDFSWIADCQRKMKSIRERTGCAKSPWEDWDGGPEAP